MTTSHKPTYHPAIGRSNAGGYRYDAPRAQFSSRDMATHMTLKTRADLVQRDQQQLREALMASENKHRQGIRDERARQGLIADDDDDDDRTSSAQIKAEPANAAAAASSSSGASATPLLPDTSGIDFSKFDDDDDDVAAATAAAAHKKAAAGSGGGGGGGSDDEPEDDDDDDDDDDEDAELARELDLIRREREEAKLRAAQAEAAEAEAAATAALAANPLLPHLSGAGAGGPTFGQDTLFGGGAGSNGGVKRRWDDDVVFKNQAKGAEATQRAKKRFINDTIRSDFHRAFIGRYVK